MTQAKKSEKEKEGKAEFDFGIGSLSLGGIFEGISKLVELAERAEKAGGELRREGILKFPGARKDVRGVYGFTIRTGLGEKRGPRIETFGNIRPTKKGPKIEKVREPIVDVFDEKDYIRIVAELPGVDEKSIKVDIQEDMVILEARGDDRQYRREILFPAKVTPKNQKVSFKNGILELKLQKKQRN